jgi:LysM repeat protein
MKPEFSRRDALTAGQEEPGCAPVRLVRWLIILAVACLATWPAWVLASPPPQEQVSGDLLVDGDFEAPPTWPFQDGIGEVQIAPGWRAYYLDAAPPYVLPPVNCSERPKDTSCFWMRPEFRDNSAFANRTRSGERSQKYFSYGRMHEAGLMQQVRSIPPGARVRFSIWMQAWMCSDPDACGKNGERSDAPADMHLRVGIDPLGGTDPFTTTVAWSAEQPAWDKFVQFEVETVAVSDTVTVFTHSRADWEWARKSNDVYLDDASLVIVGAYTTPTATVTSAQTATPFPDGAITYTVQMGDTLFDIALKHNTQVTDLLKLNRITAATELFLGQPLIVQVAPITSTPAVVEPSATPAPSATPEPTVTPTPVPTLTAATPATPPATVGTGTLPVTALVLVGAGCLVAALGLGLRLTLLARERRSARSKAQRLRSAR